MAWTKIGNIRGPAGLGVPAGGTTGQVLTKRSNADNDTQWSAAGSGPQGPPGPQGPVGSQGPPGLPGETWFTGTGAPTTVSGAVVGDWYLDSATGNYYDLTALPSTWTLRGNLKGPTGATGSQGPQGPQGPAGSGATTLDQLTDVDTSTTPPTNGQALIYNQPTGLWKPGAGGGGTADTRGYHRYADTVPVDIVDSQLFFDKDLVVPSVTTMDHGYLTGLVDDDHPQYLTEARQNYRIFTTTALLNAWAAANGSLALALDTNTVYLRRAGAWTIYTQPWTTFTPGLTASPTPPNLGTDGARLGRYAVSGGMCHFNLQLAFGSAGGGTFAGSGTYIVTGLPLPISSSTAAYMNIGAGTAIIGGGRYNVQCIRDGAASTQMQVYCPLQWSNSVPANATYGDTVIFSGRYEI